MRRSERTFLEGLCACGIEPRVLHTTPEDGGEGIAKRAAYDGAELAFWTLAQHPPAGKTPEVMKPLQQPGDKDE